MEIAPWVRALNFLTSSRVTFYPYFQRTPRNFQTGMVKALGAGGSIFREASPVSDRGNRSFLECWNNAPLTEELLRQKLNLTHIQKTFPTPLSLPLLIYASTLRQLGLKYLKPPTWEHFYPAKWMGPEFTPAKSTWSEDNDISLLKILDLKPREFSCFQILFHEPTRSHRGVLEVPRIFHSNIIF